MGVFAEIRAGTTEVLANLGVHTYRGYWAMGVIPPAALLKPVLGGYLETFQGGADLQFTLTVAVQIGNLEQAQNQLDALIEPDGAIASAFLANPTLGGRVSYALVTGFDSYDLATISDVDYLTAVLNLVIRV